jgi:hypothetical protein
MDLKQKYQLKKDVVSYFHPFEVYGKAGTEVTILFNHLDMMIVKDNSGNIFHSRTDNLTEIPIHSTNASSKSKTKCFQPEPSAMEPAQASKLRKQKRNNRRTGDATPVSPSLFG